MEVSQDMISIDLSAYCTNKQNKLALISLFHEN